MRSILQDWVMELGLRHQGVLISAVRGCDTAPRDEPSKLLSRCLRCEVLVPHVGDAAKSISFIQKVDADELEGRMKTVLRSFDHLPLHYWIHFVHAAEILGYKHPDSATAAAWCGFYRRAVDKLHMGVESEAQLDARLGADEDTFRRAQET